MIGLRALLRRVVPRGARNWLRSPRRTVTRVWDELRHAAGSNPTVELRPGWRLACHPAAQRALERPQRDDPAQIAELDGFLAACRQEMTLLDLGAHVGLFSFAALHRGGPRARAVAVDPSTDALRMLELGARLNRVADRLTVMHAAAGERSGWSEMLPVGVIADGYYVTPEPERARRDLVRVRVVTVDDVVAELGFPPTHLKIDVEGAEAAVLRGARRTLAVERPIVFLELHNAIVRRSGRDPGESVAGLLDLGYRLERHDGSPLTREAALAPPIVRLVARRA